MLTISATNVISFQFSVNECIIYCIQNWHANIFFDDGLSTEIGNRVLLFCKLGVLIRLFMKRCFEDNNFS